MVMVRVRSSGIYYVSEIRDRVQECLSNSNPPCIDMSNSSVIPLQRHFRDSAFNHTSVLNTSEHVSGCSQLTGPLKPN